MEEFFSLVNDYVLPHWPFAAIAAILSIIGQFTGNSLFTRARAYDLTLSVKQHMFWYWARETLPLHPLATGFIVGCFWIDPEGHGWGLVPSVAYFMASGFASLILWVAFRGYLKSKGIEVHLPGVDSEPPGSPALADVLEPVDEVDHGNA